MTTTNKVSDKNQGKNKSNILPFISSQNFSIPLTLQNMK